MCVLVLLACLALAAGVPQNERLVNQDTATTLGNYVCPEEDGTYSDPEQCDLYWTCEAGVATSRLCDDGLVFDDIKAKAGHVDPCDTPFVVDCTGRPYLQEPSHPSEYCIRRHGTFEDPDPTNCRTFHTCKDGFKENTNECAPTLHFNPDTGTCDWPQNSGRTGCVVISNNCIKNGNFCCTGEEVINEMGQSIPHPTYADELDCQKFYVCLNKVTPQESSCNLGQVYNDKTGLCDWPENVPACEGHYRNNPLFDVVYDDLDADGQRDFGVRRDFSQTSIN